MNTSSHMRGVTTVVAGVALISFDALLVRLAGVNGWDVSFWRGLFMGLSMLTVTTVRGGDRIRLDKGYWLAALMMAGSSLALVLAFTLTRVANAVVILSMSPLFAALASRFFLKEKCPLRTWVAILLCIGGVTAVMAGSIGGGNLVGDALAVLSTLFIGGYFTVFRRYPDVSRVRVISLGGFLLALFALPMAAPLSLPAASYGWLALAGLLQMPLAMVLLTSGTRFLPAAEVSLFLLLETILSPVWVWLVIGEVPPHATLFGGLLIVATLVGHTLVGMRARRAGGCGM